jgi:ATP-dependent RNA helicase SUPV3L1/SUV3
VLRAIEFLHILLDVNTSKPSAKSADLSQLDTLTGGAFTAPTSGERAARLREWLATDPAVDHMVEVYRELSHRDKGAAKALKEKLDELKRAKAQEAIAEEWAAKARTLLAHGRLNMADAMAWQRDAAKAGAPLSREPLAGLKVALAERMKAVEDLQHRVQVERETALLLAQRIEVLSTKPWHEAHSLAEALQADVTHWQNTAGQFHGDAAWDSLDPKFPSQLDASKQQLTLVWEAFSAALEQAVQAADNAEAPLPAVPVWADELRTLRGDTAPAVPGIDPAELAAQQAKATQVVGAALQAVQQNVTEGHTKATPKVVAALRAALKEHGRYVPSELEAQVQAALVQAGELEGWQRWRADQLREELVAKAVALTQAPEGQRLGGRKIQEALRQLREQWKATDQGGSPNHGLWKKFDEACTAAHKVVEVWLGKLKEQNEANRAQRLQMIEEVKAWTLAHAESDDWKTQLRDLYTFAERWRQSGHVSEKLYAELQPLWKQTLHTAQSRLDAAQDASVARRLALIEEAQALGAAPMLRIDAVKNLQQRWQQEAHSVPLERKQEQKLWESFRKPIDDAFERKGAERNKAAAAMNEHDKQVLEASKALEAANASGDAQHIRAAMQALQEAIRGQAAANQAAAEVAAPAAEPEVAPAAEEAAAKPAVKKLVAVRGDDRPGMVKATPASNARPGEKPRTGNRDERGGRDAGRRDERGGRFERSERPAFEPRGPRLGDGAFRAQREAMENAEAALRKLAAQAHGEVLTQLLTAWEQRQAEQVPAAQALGARVGNARTAWVQAITRQPAAAAQAAESLLRLEMAAEVPTPVEQLDARRALQLKLLTRRNDPAPAQTWAQDVTQVLSSAYDETQSRRLQNVLKVLLRK